MPNATQVGILDKDGNPQTVSTMDALIALVGTLGDAAWASGNGTLIGLMKAVAGNANSTGPSPVGQSTGVIYDPSGNALTPKFKIIAASSSGATTIVAAVTSKKIRVLAYNIIGNGAVNVKFQSHATPTDLTGLKYIPSAGNGLCAGFSPTGWFETVAGEALDINLSAAVAVGGELVYVEV